MEERRTGLQNSGIAPQSDAMKPDPLPLVPFSEVRHDRPDDGLFYEPVAVRGQLHDWTIPAHRHEGLHQFQFLAQGRLEGTIDGQAHAVAALALLVLAPGSVHGFTYTRNAVGHQVTVPSATLRELLDGSQLAHSGLGRSFVVEASAFDDGGRACLALFEALAHEFRGQQPGRVQSLRAHATLIAVQSLRLRGQQPAAAGRPGPGDTLVRRYQALLEAHYRSHVPLPFYAGRLGVTADHLSRTCRGVTGQSALDLLHERLMREARRLLAYTPATVAEVAQQLGYEDPAYFSKFFSRSVGETPTAYRALVAQGLRPARR